MTIFPNRIKMAPTNHKGVIMFFILLCAAFDWLNSLVILGLNWHSFEESCLEGVEDGVEPYNALVGHLTRRPYSVDAIDIFFLMLVGIYYIFSFSKKTLGEL